MKRLSVAIARTLVVTAFIAAPGCGDSSEPGESAGAYLEHGEPSDLASADGKADGSISAWSYDLIITDALYADAAGYVDAAAVQGLLEKTPYSGGVRSWLADELVDGEPFSTVLARVAEAHGVSPLMLLARMQVEASLISKQERPRQSLVDRAFGCGCFDGQACFDRFLGLTNQMTCAAETLKKLHDGSVAGTGDWRKGKTKETLDGYSITPRSHATAAMYAYTPWVLPNRGGNWLVRNVTLKFGNAIGVREGWVGTPCSDSKVCHFDHGESAGSCVHETFWLDGPSLCSVPCVGTCEDQPGAAPTFCVGIRDAGIGLCMPKSHTKNGRCASIDNTSIAAVNRYVGDSTASPATADVCVPNSLLDSVDTVSF